MATKVKLIADNVITTDQIDLTSIDTDNLSEGSTNLYFTNARVDSHLSGGTGVTYSSGTISIGQAVATTDNVTFADLTVTGDLNITGDINSYNVTDLDVTDQTITLGAGQIEANSGGSGIIVAGSEASILWDETNTEWDFNNSINVTGTVTADGLVIDGDTINFNTSAGDLEIQALGGSSNQIEGSGSIKIKAAGGAVDLINGTTEVLSTTATGINVTGTVVADGLEVESSSLMDINLIGNPPELNLEDSGGTSGQKRARITVNNQKVYLQGLSDDDTAVTHNFITGDLNDGNVGIGTTSPETKLQIVGSTNSATSTGGTLGIRQKGDTEADGITITSSHANSGRIYKDSNGSLHIYNTGGSIDDFVITNTGNVGIGTSSPQNNSGRTTLTLSNATNGGILEIFGPSATRQLLIYNDTGESRFETLSGGSEDIVFRPNGSESVRFDSSGNVGIGGTSSARLLVQNDGASTVSIVSNDGGIASINFGDTSDISRGQIQYENNTEALTFSVNNLVEAMRIDSSGNVGIGTTAPVSSGSGAKSLHVSAQGEARLVLTGDNNNIGDTGQLDAAIYMLTDGGVGTDPFGDTSSTNAGAHGYSFRVKNYSGDNTFDMMEESTGSATNLMHMNTSGDVVIGFGATSVSAGAKFEVASTNSMVIPKGTTAQRPGSAVSGAIRFNTTLGNLEQYDGSSWKMVSTVYSIDYLVLGGGGSGGDCTSPNRFGGGGGAGGLRTSYGTVSGRASTAENPLMVTSGHTLTITVGAGASGGVTTDNTPGTQGSNSSITGTSGITTITALGGGGGGANTTDGTSGGCGGGGKESDGAGQSGTIGQGFDGGTGSESGDRGGGGGGTGANGTGTGGGDGTSVSITGSAVTYGGGGATSGTAGAGGGGAGSSNGTANLGGGGGAAGSQTGAGGSGVVILRVPTTNYSGTTTGSPTVTTDGDFTVIKFTSSGTYTT